MGEDEPFTLTPNEKQIFPEYELMARDALHWAQEQGIFPPQPTGAPNPTPLAVHYPGDRLLASLVFDPDQQSSSGIISESRAITAYMKPQEQIVNPRPRLVAEISFTKTYTQGNEKLIFVQSLILDRSPTDSSLRVQEISAEVYDYPDRESTSFDRSPLKIIHNERTQTTAVLAMEPTSRVFSKLLMYGTPLNTHTTDYDHVLDQWKPFRAEDFIPYSIDQFKGGIPWFTRPELQKYTNTDEILKTWVAATKASSRVTTTESVTA